MMDVDEFEDALIQVEIGTGGGKLAVLFKNQLYEYFKDTPLIIWIAACREVALTPAPTDKIEQHDFLREVIRARRRVLQNYDQSVKRAQERRDELDKARREAAAGPSAEEITERMAKDSPFAAEQLERLRARRKGGEQA